MFSNNFFKTGPVGCFWVFGTNLVGNKYPLFIEDLCPLVTLLLMVIEWRIIWN